MQGPPNGIINGIIALTCMLALQRMVTLTFFKSRKWQQIAQGKEHLVVKDSVLDVKMLDKIDVTKNQFDDGETCSNCGNKDWVAPSKEFVK